MSIPSHQIERARDVRLEDVLERHGVRLKRSGAERIGGCPICAAGNDRFAVNLRKGLFCCRKCGGKGIGAVDLEMFLGRCDFREAVAQLIGASWTPARPIPTAIRAKAADDRSDNVAKACQRWGEGVDPRRTIVETYLSGRGLQLTDDIAGEVIRFHPRCPWQDDNGALIRVPAMLAATRDIHTDKIMAVSRRRLTPEGEKVGKPRYRGIAAGAAVKLDSDDSVLSGLHICEGAETGIAGRMLGLRPMWSLGSKNAIEAFPVLDGIECLTILTEPDAEAAVEKCARRWFEAGREVIINRSRIGKDLADAVAESRRL